MKLGRMLVFRDANQFCDELGKLIVEVENGDYPPSLAKELLALQGDVVVEKYRMDRAALEEKRRTVTKLLGE